MPSSPSRARKRRAVKAEPLSLPSTSSPGSIACTPVSTPDRGAGHNLQDRGANLQRGRSRQCTADRATGAPRNSPAPRLQPPRLGHLNKAAKHMRHPRLRDLEVAKRLLDRVDTHIQLLEA